MIGVTTTLDLKGTTALVTGASSGIGEAIAEELARRGSDLVLVARSLERLSTVAATVLARFEVAVDVVAADLTDETERARVIAACADRHIDVLVNSAGVGLEGDFVDLGTERQVAMVELNCAALTALCSAFVPAMLERRVGGVINVASLAAFQPIPKMAAYAATKAFVLSFSYSLGSEIRPRGVHVLALCPGPVATRFSGGFSDEHVATRFFSRAPSADVVARKAVARLVAGRRSSLSGPGAYGAVIASKVLPRAAVTGLVGRLFR